MVRKRVVPSLAMLSLMLGVAFAGTCEGDYLPPEVQGVSVPYVGDTWFIVQWRTNIPTVGGVHWGLTDGYGNGTIDPGPSINYHHINVTGLRRDTVYHFCVWGSVNTTDDGDNYETLYAFSQDYSVRTNPSGGAKGGYLAPVIVVASCVAIVAIVATIGTAIRRKGKATGIPPAI